MIPRVTLNMERPRPFRVQSLLSLYNPKSPHGPLQRTLSEASVEGIGDGDKTHIKELIESAIKFLGKMDCEPDRATNLIAQRMADVVLHLRGDTTGAREQTPGSRELSPAKTSPMESENGDNPGDDKPKKWRDDCDKLNRALQELLGLADKSIPADSLRKFHDTLKEFIQEFKLPPDRKCSCKCEIFCGCVCDCKCNCQCLDACQGHCEDSYVSSPRNLVVCIDGTSNQFGDNSTNVVEICNRIVKNSSSNPQLTYYNSGIGTYAKPSLYPVMYWRQALGMTLDLAFAWRFERIVQGAYRWLSDHYQPGDKIYLFGFSRGAHQIRVLAGMIKRVGLMYAGNVEQIPFAYELYLAGDGPEILAQPEVSNENGMYLASKFKETFSRNVGVHFLGAWETVTSIGLRWREPLPEMTSCDHICFFRHALALDEHRVKFLPFYVHGGASHAKDHQYGTGKPNVDFSETQARMDVQEKSSSTVEQSKSEHIKEVWFAGSHSDVGGGNRRAGNFEANLGTPPLIWMEHEAEDAGLLLKPRPSTNYTWNLDTLCDATVEDSMEQSVLWSWAKWLPFTHLSYESGHDTTRQKGHQLRVIVKGQRLHASVAFLKADYKIDALFNGENLGKSATGLAGCGKDNDYQWVDDWNRKGLIPLELDIFDTSRVKKHLETLESPQTSTLMASLNQLDFAAQSRLGAQEIVRCSGIQILAALLGKPLLSLEVASRTADCLTQLSRNQFSKNYPIYRAICDSPESMAGFKKLLGASGFQISAITCLWTTMKQRNNSWDIPWDLTLPFRRQEHETGLVLPLAKCLEDGSGPPEIDARWKCLVCIHLINGPKIPQDNDFWSSAAKVVNDIFQQPPSVSIDEQFYTIMMDLMKSAAFRSSLHSVQGVIAKILALLDDTSKSIQFWTARSFRVFGIDLDTEALFWQDFQELHVIDKLLELMTRSDGDLVVGAVSSRTLQHFVGLQGKSEASKRCRSEILRVLETDKYGGIKSMLSEHAKPNAKNLGQALKAVGAPVTYLGSRDGQVSRAFNATWLIQQLVEYADTMESLFHNGVFRLIIEMAVSPQTTFQTRGCQLLGISSRHEWPKFDTPEAVEEQLGPDALEALVKIIKSDIHGYRKDYEFPHSNLPPNTRASCAAMFVAQLCKATPAATLEEFCHLGIIDALATQMKSSNREIAHYCDTALQSIMRGNQSQQIKQEVMKQLPRQILDRLFKTNGAKIDTEELNTDHDEPKKDANDSKPESHDLSIDTNELNTTPREAVASPMATAGEPNVIRE